jgi:hypothetical protein
LAGIQEQIFSRSKYKPARPPFAARPFVSNSKDKKVPQPEGDLWRARQARDYKKTNNLCYYCGEPFSPAHIDICKKRPKKQLNQLTFEELNMDLTDDILLQLEQEDTFAEELCHISLNALSSQATPTTIRLRALVKNQVMLTLLDSGSSTSFVSSSFLQKAGITPLSAPPAKVTVADGSILLSTQYVPQLTWWIQGHTFQTDMRVIDLNVYDAILGYGWLQPRSPMNCHWQNRTIEFQDKGESIKLQGSSSSPLQSVQEMTAHQLVKWSQGNDIWACALVIEVQDSLKQSIPSAIKQLLHEFKDVFSSPSTLPPPRAYDHAIPLLPNSIPVNSRPYRYSPAHKDEIEK